MNRRSFFKAAAGVLAGAVGAGWLWSRKPDRATYSLTEDDWSGPIILAKEDPVIFVKKDAVCEVLHNHFAKRVWLPYAVRVAKYDDVFVVFVTSDDQGVNLVNQIALSAHEIGPGCAGRMNRRFDDAFDALRAMKAECVMNKGVQA